MWSDSRFTRAGLDRRGDDELDRHRLPHPILGVLAIREMRHFTLEHDRHHGTAVMRRLPRSGRAVRF